MFQSNQRFNLIRPSIALLLFITEISTPIKAAMTDPGRRNVPEPLMETLMESTASLLALRLPTETIVSHHNIAMNKGHNATTIPKLPFWVTRQLFWMLQS